MSHSGELKPQTPTESWRSVPRAAKASAVRSTSAPYSAHLSERESLPHGATGALSNDVIPDLTN